jgi:hypothetical protein
MFLVNGKSSDFRTNWENYQEYLQGIQGRLPEAARKFTLSDWHYDPQDHRCPHDARLESVAIREPAEGERQQDRKIDIQIVLLGAYHDGKIEIHYPDVASYYIARGFDSSNRGKQIGHGDWLTDEVRLSDTGLVIDEIEFEEGIWVIEAGNIEYTWKPFLAPITR